MRSKHAKPPVSFVQFLPFLTALAQLLTELVRHLWH